MRQNKIIREILRMNIQLRGIIYLPIIYYYRTFKRNFLLKKNNFFIKKNIISILCPSRGRPDKILRLINGLNEKTTYKDRVELMIYVVSGIVIINLVGVI